MTHTSPMPTFNHIGPAQTSNTQLLIAVSVTLPIIVFVIVALGIVALGKSFPFITIYCIHFNEL